MIAERMICRYFEMDGLGVSFLFECLQQRFAVRPGTITCCDQQRGALANRRSKLQEVPFVTMVKYLAAQGIG